VKYNNETVHTTMTKKHHNRYKNTHLTVKQQQFKDLGAN